MKSSHRLQTIGVLLLTIFGWLVFDLGAVKDTVWSYLEPAEGPEAPAEEIAVRAPRRVPILMGHPNARPPKNIARAAPAASGGGGRDQVLVPTAIVLSGKKTQDLHVTKTGFASAKARLRSFEDLVRALRPDDRRKAELLQILGDAAQELDDLRHQPNEDGRSWHGIVASVDRVGWGAHRGLSLALGDFIDTPLRGSEETYRGMRRRIIERYAATLRDRLDPEQQRDFDALDVSRVIDSGGMHHVFALKLLGGLQKKANRVWIATR